MYRRSGRTSSGGLTYFRTQIMKIPLYQIDAFGERLFTGNPAAVCPLTEWLPDSLMQTIAAENNLAETAFFVTSGNGFHIRWFTPSVEVRLCGHATLATAHVLWQHLGCQAAELTFESASGLLRVRQSEDLLWLNFPADQLASVPLPDELSGAFAFDPLEVFRGRDDYLIVAQDEASVQNAQPDMNRIAQCPSRGVIITAPGKTCDFVSRFFAPQSGIPEDPVTGSAHTTLTPYWAARLGKKRLNARQLSTRGGTLTCILCDDRVEIGGRAFTFLSGQIDC